MLIIMILFTVIWNLTPLQLYLRLTAQLTSLRLLSLSAVMEVSLLSAGSGSVISAFKISTWVPHTHRWSHLWSTASFHSMSIIISSEWSHVTFFPFFTFLFVTASLLNTQNIALVYKPVQQRWINMAEMQLAIILCLQLPLSTLIKAFLRSPLCNSISNRAIATVGFQRNHSENHSRTSHWFLRNISTIIKRPPGWDGQLVVTLLN